MDTRPEIVFTFTDTHNAMSGEKALIAASLPVRVMPRPSSLGQGCGICLRVDMEERDRAEAVFLESGVRTEAVYIRSRNNGGVCYSPI